MEVHRGQLRRGGIRHVDVQGLRLVDIRSAVRGHVQDHLLLDLPTSLVELLHLFRDVQLLDAAILRNQLDAQLLPSLSPAFKLFFASFGRAHLGSVRRELAISHSQIEGSLQTWTANP